MPAKMKIRSAYSTLPTAERKVADFILENPEQASLMVINEIAASAGVSVPSVTRLAKKLGYSGFMDFRVSLASGNSSLESLKSEPVHADDTDSVVVEKMFLAHMRALEDTLKALDRDKLSTLADKMVGARRIFICGASSSAILAEDFAIQMNLLGFDTLSLSDPVIMERYYSRFTADDVFLGISRSGRTKNILEALRYAKRAGAYTCFMSNHINSPALQVADSFFCTSRIDDIKNVIGRESTVSMYALVNTLMVLISRRSGANIELNNK